MSKRAHYTLALSDAIVSASPWLSLCIALLQLIFVSNFFCWAPSVLALPGSTGSAFLSPPLCFTLLQRVYFSKFLLISFCLGSAMCNCSASPLPLPIFALLQHVHVFLFFFAVLIPVDCRLGESLGMQSPSFYHWHLQLKGLGCDL